MAINKVKFGNQTLIDLTDTTATADKILTGFGAYGKDGVWMDGTAETGSGAVADTITQLPNGGDHHNVYGVDLTQDTVTAGSMLSGVTAHDSAGNAITGAIETKTSSDMTVVGRSVTVPAGYYDTEVVKSVATMTLPTSASTSGSGTNKATIGRSTATQYINIPTGYNTTAARYTISATPNGSATTPTTTITANPTISVNSSTGLITATASSTNSITPTVSAGYVSSGTAGTITVSGSNTSQLTTKSAATITPTTTSQTIASGTYLTGTQTIAGDADLVASNIKKDVDIFGVTGTYDPEPSLIAKTVTPSAETQIITPTSITETLVGNSYATHPTPTVYSASSGDEIQLLGRATGYPSSVPATYRFEIKFNTWIRQSGEVVGGPSKIVTGTCTINSLSDTPLTSFNPDWRLLSSIEIRKTSGYNTFDVYGIINAPSGYYSVNVDTYKAYLIEETQYDGLSQVTVNGDSDLVASNIKKDVEIFGVTGTFEGESNTKTLTIDPQKYQQVFTPNDSIFDFTYNDSYSSKTQRYGGSGTFGNACPMLISGSSYRVAGTVIIFDSTNQTIDSDTFDTTITLSSTDEIVYDGTYVTYKLGKTNSDTLLHQTYIYNVTDSYGITINGGFYELTNYVGFSQVTVNAYPNGLEAATFKKYLQRTITGQESDWYWPEDLTGIGPYAFAGCSSFNCSSLPSTVTSIGTYSFYNCYRLRLTSLPNISDNWIYGYTFYGCHSLRLTSLPSGLTGIGDSTFHSCRTMPLSSIPSTVNSIGQYAFYDCRRVTISTIPSGVTNITNYSFAGCCSITSISSTATITTFNSYSFNGVNSSYLMQLRTASFPNVNMSGSFGAVFGSTTEYKACQFLESADIGSVYSIGSNSFSNCHSLRTLVLRRTASATSISSNSFTNTPMTGYNSLTGTVYVPSDLISSYQTASYWSTLYNNGTVTFVAIEGSDYEL